GWSRRRSAPHRTPGPWPRRWCRNRGQLLARAPGHLLDLGQPASASATRPWVSSHRGPSGRVRATTMTTSASTGPIRKASRQPRLTAKAFRRIREANEPRIAPARYDPLIQMPTRPRYLDGIISSIAELMAAYWPPIPMPPARTPSGYGTTTTPAGPAGRESCSGSAPGPRRSCSLAALLCPLGLARRASRRIAAAASFDRDETLQSD